MALGNRLIMSAGSPEGFIEAARGTFYINTQSYSLYIKIRGDSTTKTGWFGLICKGYYDGTGEPEGRIVAPRLGYYLDNENDVLYVQMTDEPSPVEIGWVPLTEGTVYAMEGDPWVTETEGRFGDIYIDIEASTVYVKRTDVWQRLSLLTVNSSDILTNLSELLTNVVEITNTYFNLFINPTPMDIPVSQYDDTGILRTYIIPNRAKDRHVSIGNVDPNGNLSSPLGTLYLNTADRSLFIKTTNEMASDGWKALIYGGKIQEPLYVDDEGKLSIRTDVLPTENSVNMLDSSALHNMFGTKAEKNGNAEENFKVAYPVEDEDAVNVEFLEHAFQGLFSYDASTRTLKVNTTINRGA